MYEWTIQAQNQIRRHLESKYHKCGRSMVLSMRGYRDEEEKERLQEAIENFKPFCLRQYDWMTDADCKLFNIKNR